MYPTIDLGFITIPTYGLCAAIGMVAAFIVLMLTSKYRNLKSDSLFYMSLICLLGGFLGAKLLYIIVELDTFIKDPSQLLYAITGGFVFYGGLIGGIITGIIACRIKKFNTLDVADTVAAPLVLGQAFGRIGCYFAGCCYGCIVDKSHPLAMCDIHGFYRMPVQLMEAGALFIMTIVLIVVLKKVKRSGFTAGLYLVLYSVWRFIIEFFRADDRGNVGALSTSQLISLVLFPIGIALILYSFRDKLFPSKYKAVIAKPETSSVEDDTSPESDRAE
ncbi:MAG: prolipoprotein diacylglyceryl transferase [Clostridia bacterium]|nr:prolipoprotein diacylglyceryl transferase [Clostridia bacterium]